MKSRKVMIMLEVMSDLPLTTLRRRGWWMGRVPMDVEQVQANVVRPAKKKKAKKRT